MASKIPVLATNAAIVIADNHSELDLIEQNEKEIAEHPDTITKDAQTGIRKAEAAALLWSKPALYGVFAWILFLFLVIYFMSALDGQLVYYIYAEFYAAPQVTQANLVARIIGGIVGVPLSKLLNTWGRAEALLLLITVYTVGLAALAGCNGPASFAAGYVLYKTAYSGLFFILNVFVADTSGLYNRAILIGFTGIPTYVSSLAGPPIVQMFINHGTWRWAYGAFAIISPVTMLPLAYVLKMYQKKAEARGIYTRPAKVDRTIWQTVVQHFVEFDFMGAFLLGASFLLMLLPFTLHGASKATYGSAQFIAPIVIGILLFPVFILWECYGLPSENGKYYIRWDLLKNRTVFGACMVADISFFNYDAWDSY
ncbi:hypothetical protein SEPCBS57363_006670 [Sporothrix epigloea]|uniref:Siderophore iron transporter n=1 Tax=Sporothrix epigloea TaxID=1892477 RepID=A0ABP0E4B1_9PEZI